MVLSFILGVLARKGAIRTKLRSGRTESLDERETDDSGDGEERNAAEIAAIVEGDKRI